LLFRERERERERERKLYLFSCFENILININILIKKYIINVFPYWNFASESDINQHLSA